MPLAFIFLVSVAARAPSNRESSLVEEPDQFGENPDQLLEETVDSFDTDCVNKHCAEQLGAAENDDDNFKKRMDCLSTNANKQNCIQGLTFGDLSVSQIKAFKCAQAKSCMVIDGISEMSLLEMEHKAMHNAGVAAGPLDEATASTKKVSTDIDEVEKTMARLKANLETQLGKYKHVSSLLEEGKSEDAGEEMADVADSIDETHEQLKKLLTEKLGVDASLLEEEDDDEEDEDGEDDIDASFLEVGEDGSIKLRMPDWPPAPSADAGLALQDVSHFDMNSVNKQMAENDQSYSAWSDQLKDRLNKLTAAEAIPPPKPLQEESKDYQNAATTTKNTWFDANGFEHMAYDESSLIEENDNLRTEK